MNSPSLAILSVRETRTAQKKRAQKRSLFSRRWTHQLDSVPLRDPTRTSTVPQHLRGRARFSEPSWRFSRRDQGHEGWELDLDSEADLLRQVYDRIQGMLRIPSRKIECAVLVESSTRKQPRCSTAETVGAPVMSRRMDVVSMQSTIPTPGDLSLFWRLFQIALRL